MALAEMNLRATHRSHSTVRLAVGVCAGAMVAFATLAGSSARAQVAASNRPITLVVPFSPGAANDTMARILAPQLKAALGSVVVDNRPGADGVIGANAVLNAPHDGHTVLVAPDQYVIAAALGEAQPFDFERDFAAVARTNALPFFLVTHPKVLPAENLAAVVAELRARPGQYTYGSAGNGSPHNLAMLMLLQHEHLDLVHVPYKGMGQGIPDFIAGRIQLVITGLPAVSSHLKDGRLRVLATVGTHRTSLRPDTPTFAEVGVNDVQMDTWLGLLVPRDSPRAMIERINRAVNAALQLPEVREQMAAQGMEIGGGTPEEFAAIIQTSGARYRALAQSTQIGKLLQ